MFALSCDELRKNLATFPIHLLMSLDSLIGQDNVWRVFTFDRLIYIKSFNSVIASLPSRMETIALKIWFHTNHQSFKRDHHELSRYQVSISSGCSISTITYRSTVKWNYCRWWLGMMCINLLSPCLYVERFEPWDCSGDGCVIWKIYCNLLLQWKVLQGSNGHLLYLYAFILELSWHNPAC